MKKLLSTLIVIAVFAFAAFADGHADSPGVTCVDGHADSPGKCESKSKTGQNGFAAEGDSTTFDIASLIAEYDPFVFFLN